jgi:hypothetical protein
VVYGDRAYTDYQEEDLLQEAAGITLRAQRKKNSKRPLPLCLEFLGKPIRQRVETTFSQLEALLPHHIHAGTDRGFTLKAGQTHEDLLGFPQKRGLQPTSSTWRRLLSANANIKLRA